MRCQIELMNAGGAYPRTCPTCGLSGACVKGLQRQPSRDDATNAAKDDAPEWKTMTDWSGLPDVYVTKAECQQGMFWRIEACSVPMAIGPEVRLTLAHPEALAASPVVQAMLREARAEGMERAAEADFPDSWRDDAHEVHAGPGLKAQRTWAAGFQACRNAIRAEAAAVRKGETK